MPVHQLHRILIGMAALFSMNSNAQVLFSTFLDAGKNNVSEGLFVKTAAAGEFRYGTNIFGIATQVDLVSNKETLSPALSLDYCREFSIRKSIVEVKAFFIYLKPSELFKESNWGILLELHREHFIYKLGNNFRTYSHTREAVTKYEIDKQDKIHENFNLMYSLTYFIKPSDHIWNIGISLTNCDHFLIHQETNPVFNLHAGYKPNQSLGLFLESWYKSGGAFNLSVNSFGYFFRTGIRWYAGY